MSVDALDSFLEGAAGSEEVMSWEGICDDNFDLTHELLNKIYTSLLVRT